jgi:Cof subfamily protein (haloacid dehalogenase superfamily)
MNVKSVFLDLDGTVLHDDKTISKRLTDVVTELKKRINIYVSTGRSWESASSYVEKLGLEDLAINYNGARIINLKTKEVISEKPLNEETVKKLIAVSREHKIHLNLYKDDKWYVENAGREAEYYSNLTDIKWNLINFDDFMGKKSTKALFVAEYKRLEEIKEILQKKLSGVEYVFSSEYYMEILQEGVNKGSAVKKVLEESGVSKDEAMAFGDHWNDKEMLQYVKYGYLMGNAPENLKEVFDKEKIIAANNEDGVAQILEKLI